MENSRTESNSSSSVLTSTPAPGAAPKRFGISRRWIWSAAVLVVAGGLAYAFRSPAAVEETNQKLEFNFAANGAGNGGAAAKETSATVAGETTSPPPLIKGGITDLLNEHPIETAAHPLDPLLMIAQRGLDQLRGSLRDYSATLERQERVDEQLLPAETITLKIRQGLSAEENAGNVVARGIYTRHEAPKSLRGQEAIFVAGENDGNIVAHTTGVLNLRRFYLPPTGFLAMRGSRYPMTEAGFEVLIQRMLERGQRDREFGPCEVRVDRQALVNGRACTMFEIVHPKKEGPYDFHIARIAIDDQLNLPIHYESYQWPAEPGGRPELLERYTYTNIQINPGLPAETFSPDNPAYNYPKH
ncbi:MAG: DUF1571 domain-containing protein [Pirellulaceae bacterium]|nr:DUF1571 domain-containing protein [Pirellulaceae bacterium]